MPILYHLSFAMAPELFAPLFGEIMTRPSPQDMAQARAALQDVAADPPLEVRALEARLLSLDPTAARAALLEWLQGSDFRDTQQLLFLTVAKIFDLAAEPAPLLAMLENRQGTPAGLAGAMMLLTESNPAALVEADLEISPEFQAILAAGSLASVMGVLLEDPAARNDLVDAICHTDPTEVTEALEHLDEDRRAFMIPAWVVYGPCLTRPELADHHGRLVEIIAAESLRTSLDIWDDIWQLGLAEPGRELVQKRIMQCKTAALEGQIIAGYPSALARSVPAPVRGVFSECDGQGAFTVMVEVTLPNGNVNLHNMVRRLDGDLRDGFTLGNREPGILDQIVKTFAEEQDLKFVPGPLSQFQEWGLDALSSLRGEPECREAASHLVWAAGMVEPETATAPSCAASFTSPPVPETWPEADELRDLFFDHHLSWFLDTEQLEELGVAIVDVRQAGPEVLNANMARLDQPWVRARLQDLLDHMAYFCHCAGCADPDDPLHARGPLYQAASVMLDDDDGAMAVLVPFLVSSLEAAAIEAMPLDPDAPGGSGIGDPVRRQRLRELGFSRLSHPKGKHMAYLDFSEAAHHVLASILDGGHPDFLEHDASYQVALALGKAYVDAIHTVGDAHLLHQDGRRFKRLIKALKKHAGFDEDQAMRFWDLACQRLAAFEDSVCMGCAAACLDRPTGNLREWFYGDEHPAQGEFR